MLEFHRLVAFVAHQDYSVFIDANLLASFNRDFQDFITRHAWGEIWARPGLSRQARSLLTLAMMIALNRGEEFRMHVKAALNNGVTRDEIKEVLLHSAIYCGVPAANSAFHAAADVFKEIDGKTKTKSKKRKQR